MHYASPGGGVYSGSSDENYLDQGAFPNDEYQPGYVSPSYGFAHQASYNQPNTVYVPGIRRSRFVADNKVDNI